MTIIVVCGLAAEAKIARGRDDVTVIAGGGNGAWITAQLEAAAATAQGFISFGVAGGLEQGLVPGDVRVASGIIDPEGRRYPTEARWAERLSRKLDVPRALFTGVDAPLADVAGKAALHEATGAATVDMESHLVAACAYRVGLPFVAIRVVTDPADRALPHAATVGMRADGKVDLPAILRSLMKDPSQLRGLIRTGRDAKVAFASLLRCRQLLGPGFAFLDLG